MNKNLSLFVLLSACGATPKSSVKPPVFGDTGSGVETLPEVWGLATLEDHDPDPTVVELHFDAASAEIQWLEDGSASAFTYAGTIPGPLIQARVGDTIRAVFTNNLPEGEATTIHWHGLRIANDMDGVPAVQSPVQPGETFTYEFVVPDSGSYWYHPHVRTNVQLERGLYGAIVIHEEIDYALDKDRYFVIDDVRVDDDGDFAAVENLQGPDGVHGRHGNMLLINGEAEPLSDTVRPSGVERWRIVNTANARTMWVTVKGADWRVIAVDGPLLPQPYTADYLRVPVGRRFDLEVIAHGDADEVSLEIMLPGESAWNYYPMFVGSVEGEAGAGEQIDWKAPAIPPVTGVEQTTELELNVNSDTALEWTINGDTYAEADDIRVQHNVPGEVLITNLSAFEHPFHLHGQFFQVVERNGEPAEQPGWHDTVLVEGQDTLKLLTNWDNPGRWMAHCHILEHAELGMMREIVVE